MNRNELIEYYERNLEKVKMMHSIEKAKTELLKDKCRSYIEFAERELEEVKNGRAW